MELDGTEDLLDEDDEPDDAEERDCLLLPLLLLLLDTKLLPEADDRLVKGEGLGRLRLLVGDGTGRVCGALLPPPIPGRPPPPTPRGPLRLPLLDELTMAVCFFNDLAHFAQYHTRRGSLTSWSVTGGLWHS